MRKAGSTTGSVTVIVCLLQTPAGNSATLELKLLSQSVPSTRIRDDILFPNTMNMSCASLKLFYKLGTFPTACDLKMRDENTYLVY